MAYDEQATARFRAALGDLNCTEKRMMGGVCFLLNGHMIGGVDRPKGGISRFMFRIGKANQQKGAAMPLAQPMLMAGRPMRGMFFVDAADCDDALLRRWIELAMTYAGTLPPK